MRINHPVIKKNSNHCVGMLKGFTHDKEGNKLIIVSFLDNPVVTRPADDYEEFIYWFNKKRGL